MTVIKRGVGRPPLNVTMTGVRLPKGLAERIDALMGKEQKRAEFIREVVVEAVERLERERGIKPPAQKRRAKATKGKPK